MDLYEAKVCEFKDIKKVFAIYNLPKVHDKNLILNICTNKVPK